MSTAAAVPAPDRISSIADALTGTAFVLALFLPGLVLVARSGVAEELSEKRGAAPGPDWSLADDPLRRIPVQVSAWFRDRVPGRAAAVRFHHRLRLALGATRVGGVLVGEDGWLFVAGNASLASLLRAQPVPGSLERWVTVLRARRDWARRRGARYLLVVAPDKHTIHAEHLPAAWRPPAGVPSHLDRLLPLLRGRVEALDLRAALLDARATGAVYARTDSHWNDAGALVAAGEIARALGGEPAGLRPLLRADCLARLLPDQPGGDLSALLALDDWLREGPVLRLHPPQPPRSGLRLAFTSDSFGPILAPLLRASCAELLQVGRGELEQLEHLAPDVLVEEVVERSFVGEPLFDLPPG